MKDQIQHINLSDFPVLWKLFFLCTFQSLVSQILFLRPLKPDILSFL